MFSTPIREYATNQAAKRSTLYVRVYSVLFTNFSLNMPS